MRQIKYWEIINKNGDKPKICRLSFCLPKLFDNNILKSNYGKKKWNKKFFLFAIISVQMSHVVTWQKIK